MFTYYKTLENDKTLIYLLSIHNIYEHIKDSKQSCHKYIFGFNIAFLALVVSSCVLVPHTAEMHLWANPAGPPLQSDILVLNITFYTEIFYVFTSREVLFILIILFCSILKISRTK